MSMNATKIKDSTQPVLVLDHDVQNQSETNLRKYELIEAFAKQHGLIFFRAGLGIGHQVSTRVSNLLLLTCCPLWTDIGQ